MTRPHSLALVTILGPLLVACAHNTHISRMEFEAKSEAFTDAVAEYRAIWADDGARIIDVMERTTKLRMEAEPITVIIYEGVSRSGFHDIPMWLRASYPHDTKRATLVHEMCHRLISDLVPKRFEDHPIIFLVLYDIWVDLWGREFADAQVAVESRRRGLYDYEGAWNTAVALGAGERASQWRHFMTQQKR